VRALVKGGSDVIKITATGGVLSDVNSGTGQQLFDDEMKSIVATAHLLGRKVAAHAHQPDGINAALRAGVDSIDHGTLSNDESFRLFNETGAYLVPTLLAGHTVNRMLESSDFLPPATRAKAQDLLHAAGQTLGRAHAKGVKIAFGTDSGVSRHGTNAQEFQHMVDAGMSPMDAIVAATVNAADLLGLSDEIGTIEPGKSADIIAVNGDPLEEISELERVTFVMRTGLVVKAESDD
jgi:imidazolonepropionase-like amidohydrolase